MKCPIILPSGLLLLWTLTAIVSCKEGIVVKTLSDAIVLSCANMLEIRSNDVDHDRSGKVPYKDENTGEYNCINSGQEIKIYVKFRSCDNCIELDENSIVGLVVGDVLATIVIGVAVYLIASQTRIGPSTSHKKSSDRQHLVPNEMSSRAPNDHYQPLKLKGGQKDMYDVLANRR